MSIKIRLIIMNFLQFAVWGAYLTSMGSYLVNVGLHEHIGMFTPCRECIVVYACRSRIIADRWIPAQKLLSFSHFTAALFMAAAGYYGMTKGADVDFGTLFTLYSLSVAFYMPTLHCRTPWPTPHSTKPDWIPSGHSLPYVFSAQSDSFAPCGWWTCSDCKIITGSSLPAPSSE